MADRLKVLEHCFKSCNLNLKMLIRDEDQESSLSYCDGEQNTNKNKTIILNTSEIKNKNVHLWSERVAEMTAGYLPGDLIRLIRKAEGESKVSHTAPHKP